MKLRPALRGGEPCPAERADRSSGERLLRRLAPILFLLVISSVGFLNADHEEWIFDSRPAADLPQFRDMGQALGSLWRSARWPGAQLTFVTFAANHALNERLGLPGDDVTGFLVCNVLIHAANACLVYLLILALLRAVDSDRSAATWIALAPATLFAVHPLRAANVVYILQRREMLVAAFCLIGLLAYLRFRSAVGWRGRVGFLLGVAVSFWLGCKAKTSGLVIPFAVLAVEFCIRAPDRRALRRSLGWLFGGLGIAMVAIFSYLSARGLFDPQTSRIAAWGDEAAWGPWSHFLTESRVFAHYWKLILLPLPRWMAIDHDVAISHGLLDHAAILTVALHGVLIAGSAVAARRGFRIAAFGVLLFYIALIPWVVLPQKELFVEYKTYLSSIGAALVVAELLSRLRNRVSARIVAGGLVVVVVLLLVTTVRRNAVYRDPVALWQDAAEKAPHRARVHTALGTALKMAGRWEDAVAAYQRALQLDPQYERALANLGKVQARLGRFEEAAEAYRRTLAISPDNVHVRHSLGLMLESVGRLDEAIGEYRAVLQTEPNHLLSCFGLGVCLHRMGSLEPAVEAYRAALAVDPRHADARCNLGLVLSALGSKDEAAEQLRQAVRDNPRHAPSIYALGNARLARGDLEGAAGAYRRVLGIDPRHADARCNLGAALARLGREAEAVSTYLTTLKVHPRHLNARLNLAKLLDKQGKLDEAIAEYRQVLRLRPDHPGAKAALRAATARQQSAEP